MNKIEILTCHCKKVHIELKLENGLEELVRCNCSLCKRRVYNGEDKNRKFKNYKRK